MNERTKRQLLKHSEYERVRLASHQFVPLNLHAPLLLSLKAVTHHIVYQLHTLSLDMRLLIGIYMTHRKICARCCLDERPSIRCQPNLTTSDFLCQEPFDLIRLTMHFSVVRSVYLWGEGLFHTKNEISPRCTSQSTR
jgi:hypothetical protein